MGGGARLHPNLLPPPPPPAAGDGLMLPVLAVSLFPQTQVSGLQGEGRALRAERDRLSETSSELRSKVEGAEGRVRELEAECQR